MKCHLVTQDRNRAFLTRESGIDRGNFSASTLRGLTHQVLLRSKMEQKENKELEEPTGPISAKRIGGIELHYFHLYDPFLIIKTPDGVPGWLS